MAILLKADVGQQYGKVDVNAVVGVTDLAHRGLAADKEALSLLKGSDKIESPRIKLFLQVDPGRLFLLCSEME